MWNFKAFGDFGYLDLFIYILMFWGGGQLEMDLSILVAQNACLTKLQYLRVSLAHNSYRRMKGVHTIFGKCEGIGLQGCV